MQVSEISALCRRGCVVAALGATLGQIPCVVCNRVGVGLLPTPLSGGNRLHKTWLDLGDPPPERVWQHIRLLRHAPPGRAHSPGARRKVFNAALEQAEQLFAAAASVASASRPILLFYGFNQAGRAVAAASTDAGHNEWRLVGHGLKVRNLNQRPPLNELVISDDGAGSFTQRAPMLRSGSLPHDTDLGQVWNVIPGAPLPDSVSRDLCPLKIQAKLVKSGHVTAWIKDLPLRFKDATEAELVDFLSSYPSLAGSSEPQPDFDPQIIEKERAVDIARRWQLSPSQDIQAFQRSVTQPYRGDDERWAFPVLGGSKVPLSPFLAWWGTSFHFVDACPVRT